MLGLDSPAALALLPRVLQAVFCAGGDVATYVLAGNVFGEHAARLALMCHTSSWLVFYMGVRTFSTSMEAPMTAVALALWPAGWRFDGDVLKTTRGSFSPAMACAAFACIVRPTAALFWLPFWFYEMVVLDFGARWRLFTATAVVGAVAVTLSTACDSYMYGGVVFVPWRFISFNVLQSGASAFGVHNHLWYVYAGIPMVLATMAPFTFVGVLRSHASPIVFASACFLAALSVTPHKEFRFLLPLLSPAFCYAGGALAQLGRLPVRCLVPAPRWMVPHRTWFHVACAVIVVPQLLGALYLSLVHQSAPDVVLRHLAQAAAAGHIGAGGILMLTPCHETPGYSHLHVPVPMVILDCSPQWRPGRPGAAQSEANERDAFFADPAGHLDKRFRDLSGGGSGLWNGSEPWASRVGRAVPPPAGLPSAVVAYDDIAAVVEHALVEKWGYAPVRRTFHAHFPVDRDQRALVIYVRGPWDV